MLHGDVAVSGLIGETNVGDKVTKQTDTPFNPQLQWLASKEEEHGCEDLELPTSTKRVGSLKPTTKIGTKWDR
jgi:hypothetical protein